MRTLLRFLMCALAGGFVPAHAQVQLPTANPQTQFSSGQDVVPVYEGWLRNPDGTFTFVFGYFNRNWKEELAIPAGPDNKLEPGVPNCLSVAPRGNGALGSCHEGVASGTSGDVDATCDRVDGEGRPCNESFGAACVVG